MSFFNVGDRVMVSTRMPTHDRKLDIAVVTAGRGRNIVWANRSTTLDGMIVGDRGL